MSGLSFNRSHLVAVTSWRLPPSPQAAEGSWGPGPAQRRRRPVRPHGDQGTEGQHPVGSMPEKQMTEGSRKSYQGSGRLPQHGALIKHITRHTHFTPFAFLPHERFPQTWHLFALYPHYRMISGVFCAC